LLQLCNRIFNTISKLFTIPLGFCGIFPWDTDHLAELVGAKPYEPDTKPLIQPDQVPSGGISIEELLGGTRSYWRLHHTALWRLYWRFNGLQRAKGFLWLFAIH
jgi:hypothetical protein